MKVLLIKPSNTGLECHQGVELLDSLNRAGVLCSNLPLGIGMWMKKGMESKWNVLLNWGKDTEEKEVSGNIIFSSVSVDGSPAELSHEQLAWLKRNGRISFKSLLSINMLGL